jgi:hypothetical protein
MNPIGPNQYQYRDGDRDESRLAPENVLPLRSAAPANLMSNWTIRTLPQHDGLTDGNMPLVGNYPCDWPFHGELRLILYHTEVDRTQFNIFRSRSIRVVMFLSFLCSTILFILEMLSRPDFEIMIINRVIPALTMVQSGYFILRAAWFNRPGAALWKNADLLAASAVLLGAISLLGFILEVVSHNPGKVGNDICHLSWEL